MDTHKFNEAINGVFRSHKSEVKKRQSENRSYNSKTAGEFNKNIGSNGKGQKTLKQMMNKNQRLSSNGSDFDKENTNIAMYAEEN